MLVDQVKAAELERERVSGGLLSFSAPHNKVLLERLTLLLLPDTVDIDNSSGEEWAIESHQLHGCRYLLPVTERREGRSLLPPMALSDGEAAFLALARHAWRAVDSVAPGWRVRCEPPICVVPYCLEDSVVRFADPLCFGLEQLPAQQVATKEAHERCRTLKAVDDSYDVATRELSAELHSHFWTIGASGRPATARAQFRSIGSVHWPPYVRGAFKRNDAERTWDMKRRLCPEPRWRRAEDDELEAVVVEVARRVEERLQALGVPIVRLDEDSRGCRSHTDVFSRLASRADAGVLYDDRRHVVYAELPDGAVGDEELPAARHAEYAYAAESLYESPQVARGVAPDAGVGGGGWRLAERAAARRPGGEEAEEAEAESSGDEWETCEEQMEREQRWREHEQVREEVADLEGEQAQKASYRAYVAQRLAEGAPPPEHAPGWQDVINVLDARLQQISAELAQKRGGGLGDLELG